MLCPNCKQEKWNDPVCPGCGLDQKAALSALGARCLKEDRPLEAARAYEACLRLDPEDWGALRQRAIAWYAQAQADRDPALFDPADRALAQALGKDWEWEQGHQFRVNLAYTFTRLPDLRRQYQADAQVPARADQADRVLKVIDLTERFAAPPDLPGETGGGERPPIAKWLLPLGLLTLPLWLWLALKLLSPGGQTHGPADNAPYVLAAGVFFLGMGSVLFLIPLISRPGKKQGKKPGEGPPPP